eukprot:1621347-Alexandrium_andersonii.AAC.1
MLALACLHAMPSSACALDAAASSCARTQRSLARKPGAETQTAGAQDPPQRRALAPARPPRNLLPDCRGRLRE